MVLLPVVGIPRPLIPDQSSSTCCTIITTTAGEDSETKKKYGENDEYMSHLVSYKCFMRTQYITSIGLFYKNWGRLWRVSDCEELVGVTDKR